MTLAIQLWQQRTKVLAFVVVFFIALSKRQGEKIASLESQLAQKPRVETREVVKTVVKTVVQKVQGPVEIRERVIEKPGAERIVERVVLRGPITTMQTNEESSRHSESHIEKPVCPAPERKNRWIAGVSFTPEKIDALPIVRGGYSWGNRLDLTYGYAAERIGGHQHLIETSLRF